MNKGINKIKKYVLNCFLLTLPVMLWNVVFTDELPAAYQPGIFWNKIPLIVSLGENISRTIVFLFAALMPLSLASKTQQRGFVIYVAGLLIYFASWLALIYYPHSEWSNSYPGFVAPAVTPLFWLAGIALIGRDFYFGLPFSRWLFIIPLLFSSHFITPMPP